MCKARKTSSVFGYHKRNAVWVIFTTLALTTGSVAFGAVQSSSANAVKGGNKRTIIRKVVKLQMPFVANGGQISDKRVRFYAQTFGGRLYVTEQGESVHSL